MVASRALINDAFLLPLLLSLSPGLPAEPLLPCSLTVNQVGQNFTFVLTDIESKQRFGFCRLSSGAHTCYCILRWECVSVAVSSQCLSRCSSIIHGSESLHKQCNLLFQSSILVLNRNKRLWQNKAPVVLVLSSDQPSELIGIDFRYWNLPSI